MRQIVIALVVLGIATLAATAQAAVVQIGPKDGPVGHLLDVSVQTAVGALTHFDDGSTVVVNMWTVKLDADNDVATQMKKSKKPLTWLGGQALDHGRFYVEKPFNGEAIKGYVGAGLEAQWKAVEFQAGIVVSVKDVRDAGLFVVGTIPIL